MLDTTSWEVGEICMNAKQGENIVEYYYLWTNFLKKVCWVGQCNGSVGVGEKSLLMQHEITAPLKEAVIVK